MRASTLCVLTRALFIIISSVYCIVYCIVIRVCPYVCLYGRENNVACLEFYYRAAEYRNKSTAIFRLN